MTIQAEVQRVRDVFSAGADLRVPPYQRGFAWTNKETGALIEDLLERFRASTIYFLGTIVLIQPNKRHGDISDGQQRLTVLTIILAVLRDLTDNSDEASMLQSLIGQEGAFLQPDRWRLTLNHLDEAFFRQNVQVRGTTSAPDEIVARAEESQSDSQKRLAAAVMLIHGELSDMSQEERSRFIKWLADEVSLVKVRVSEYNIAYKVFIVLNKGGLPLSDQDMMKAYMFEQAAFPFDVALRHATNWTGYLQQLGSRDFEKMLKHIRYIHDRKSQGELLDGLIYAIKGRMSIQTFIEDRLPRYVDAYDKIIRGLGAQSGLPQEAVDAMTFLRSIHHESWRAPALKLLDELGGDFDLATKFLTELERLAFMLQYSVRDSDFRARRYRQVLDSMEQPGKMLEPGAPVYLRREEARELRDRLRGRFPNQKQRLDLVKRICAAAPGGVALATDSDSTVEHILPRAPTKTSEWMTDWSRDRDREELTDCLGNYTLLTVAENQEADRKGFAEKLDIYFRNGAPSHALSEDLRGRTQWRPDDVRERRDRLVALMVKAWRLDE